MQEPFRFDLLLLSNDVETSDGRSRSINKPACLFACLQVPSGNINTRKLMKKASQFARLVEIGARSSRLLLALIKREAENKANSIVLLARS